MNIILSILLGQLSDKNTNQSTDHSVDIGTVADQNDAVLTTLGTSDYYE